MTMLQPKTSFDFTSALLDPRITFARSLNTATRINSSGLIELVNADVARFDFNPITLACRGLLVEEQRTNSSQYSENFATDRIATRVTVSSDQTTAPDGSANGDKLIASVDNNTHTLIRSISFAASLHTISYFFKAGEYSRVRLYYASFAATRADFDLAAGTVAVAGTAAPTARITPMANSWYRCSMTFTGTGSAVAIGIAMLNNAGATGFAGNGSDGIFIFGEQTEAGDSPTSYIPNVATGTTTRNADDALITGTAFSGFWRSGPGSILVRALPSTVSGTRPLVQVDDNTADNIIALRGNATNPELYIRAGGSDQATIDAGTISAAAYRLAGAWQAGSAAASLNSGLAVNGAPASIPAPTQMRLGSDGTNYLNGHLQAVQYWPVRLSNAGLQTASSTAGYQSIIHPVSRDTIITEPV